MGLELPTGMGIITVKKQEHIINIDACAEKITGYKIEDIKNKSLKKLFTDFNTSDKNDIIKESIRKKQIFEIVTKIGEKKFVEVETRQVTATQVVMFVKELSQDPVSMKNLVKNLKIELDKKDRKLAVQELVLAAKDELLHELKQKIQEIGKGNTGNIHDLAEMVNYDFNENKDWEMFKVHFQEVHPRFFRSLKNLAPSLTNEDLRLCAYIRINFSTSQIASIFHIKTKSVDKKRNRLRKKFGLTSDINLLDFLSSI